MANNKWRTLLAVPVALAAAAPLIEPTRVPTAVAIALPLITDTPRLQHQYGRRDIFDDIKSDVKSLIGDLPSYVLSGVPEFFQNLPTGNAVKSSLGISDEQLAPYPTQVLNIPPYANWTNQGWNVRFRGNVYKMPNISQEKLDDLANIFLIDVDIKDLPPNQQANARNMTASIFVVQQEDQEVSFSLEPAPSAGSDGEPGGGGAVTPVGGSQNITLPSKTTDQGDFDIFLPIKNVSGKGLMAGNQTKDVQRLNVYAHGTLTGNATAYLVPEQGLTVVSDIDDIMRTTKIYVPKEGLLNSFARDFVPWMNMPEIFANWSRSIPGIHFHYLTTTPEQATRPYMHFVYNNYPGGSFDTRPLNFSDVSATLSIRKFLLDKIFQTFPQRKFVLIADTSNSDIMKAYPEMAKTYGNQVACILLRNTSATDSSDLFPYNTAGFKGLDKNRYMFFREPNDLVGLDIVNGHCLNASIPQNVTFGYQAELLGIHGAAAHLGASTSLSLVAALAAAFFLLF